jgi:hypothetical protein
MLEEGLSLLLEADPTVASLAATRDYLVQLPEGTVTPAWTYMIVSDHPKYTMDGKRTRVVSLQIDCYANEEDCGGGARDAALGLGYAIDAILSGFRGVLTDSDSTYIDTCFQTDMETPAEDPWSRSFRMMLEYELHVPG